MATAYPVGNALARALAVLREEGLPGFWFRLASALGYRRLLLLQRSLQREVPPPRPGLPLEFATLELAEVDLHLAFRPDLPRERVLGRLASGQQCFVARHEGRIVSTCWASLRSARSEFLSCEFALSPGEVYLYDAFTLPAFRGKGAAPALCLHQLARLRAAGLRRAIRATLPENVSALRAHAKSGFEPFALMRSLKIGPWQHTVQRPWQSDGL